VEWDRNKNESKAALSMTFLSSALVVLVSALKFLGEGSFVGQTSGIPILLCGMIRR
jgi:hypothetical protein